MEPGLGVCYSALHDSDFQSAGRGAQFSRGVTGQRAAVRDQPTAIESHRKYLYAFNAADHVA